MCRPERRAYVEQVRGEAGWDALRASLRENLISLKAVVDDLRQDGARGWTSLRGGRAEELWFYNALAEVYRLRLLGALTDEMTRLTREVGPLANDGSWFDIDSARSYSTKVCWTFASTMWRWPHEYESEVINRTIPEELQPKRGDLR
jgi:hypothetical protein